MRKFQKKQADELVKSIDEAHEELKSFLKKNNNDLALTLLGQCQDAMYSLYDFIIDLEGEECLALNDIASYCSLVFQIHTEVSEGGNFNINNILKRLNKSLISIINSVNNIEVKLEIVFFPYKASMWDSLESVWLAAKDDDRCDVYVVPIPYYERNKDWSFGQVHYEGDKYPEDVPITLFTEYILEERKPDIVYIHNPYDGNNYVTSVDPNYYSDEIKKHTDLLIYIPYYSTSGSMSMHNGISQSYFNVDYIITQSKGINDYFDKRIPKEKLVALGTPKFDRIIDLCKNRPIINSEWERKISNKKVYFYNTSIAGMLQDTPRFLQKMEYVFNNFKGRNDACLLWRPHPLLESTFVSMRPHLYETYCNLKQYFIQSDFGIYDDTPDIEKSISISDAYIGDEGTSVISLFGIAGKPIFILNNKINTEPKEDDWKYEIINSLNYINPSSNKYQIVNRKNLFISEDGDYNYKFKKSLTNLSNDKSDLYIRAIESNGKTYICPNVGDRVLIYDGTENISSIKLKEYEGYINTFNFSILIGEYIFLIPEDYPAIVRLDTNTLETKYIEGYNEVFVDKTSGQSKFGNANMWNEYLVISSPTDDRILFLNSISLEVQILMTGAKKSEGYSRLIPNGEEIWCLPFNGYNIVKWNVITGDCVEYDNLPKGLEFEKNLQQKPFINAVFYDDNVIFAPLNANMFVCLNQSTGEMTEWEVPFPVSKTGENCYSMSMLKLYFIQEVNKEVYEVYSQNEQKIYKLNIRTKEFEEKNILFNKMDMLQCDIGFVNITKGLIYACKENSFNSLKDFLDGNITGNAFIKDEQLKAYREISENSDGTCGLNVHKFAMDKMN